MTNEHPIITKILENALSSMLVHCVWAIMALVAMFMFSNQLSRAIDVLERMDDRVEQAFVGIAPVGKVIVEKGITGVSEIDAKELASKATKRLGDFIDRKQSND